MRLSPAMQTAMTQAVRRVAPNATAIWLFGSRLDDDAKGGDVDLMVEFAQPVEQPALLAARIAVQVMRALGGREVDVVLKAPNLSLSGIHRVAMEYGIQL